MHWTKLPPRNGIGGHYFRGDDVMMTSKSMFDYVTAEPFQPFRMNMASGKTYAVRHPEMVKVGKTSVVVYSVVPDAPELGTHWNNISLMLIESIEPLDAGVSRKDGKAQ